MSVWFSLKPPLWTDLVWVKCQMNRRNAYFTITLIYIANEGVWACAGFSAGRVRFDLIRRIFPPSMNSTRLSSLDTLNDTPRFRELSSRQISFYKCSKARRGIKARGPVATSCETLEVRRHWPEWLTTVQCSRNSSIYSWAAMSSRFHTLSALETQRPFELWQSLEAQSWLICSMSVRLSGMCVFGEVVDSCCTSRWDNRRRQECGPAPSEAEVWAAAPNLNMFSMTVTTLSPHLAVWLFQAFSMIDWQAVWPLLLGFAFNWYNWS